MGRIVRDEMSWTEISSHHSGNYLPEHLSNREFRYSPIILSPIIGESLVDFCQYWQRLSGFLPIGLEQYEDSTYASTILSILKMYPDTYIYGEVPVTRVTNCLNSHPIASVPNHTPHCVLR